MSVCRVLCGVMVAVFLVSESWAWRPQVVGPMETPRDVASVGRLAGTDGVGELPESGDAQLDGSHSLIEQRRCDLATGQGAGQQRSCSGVVCLDNG